MVQINFAQKSVTVKIVYYGPGMSGKTTNLEIVHQRAPENSRGDLTSISTDGDRTLFFDFMPLDLGTVAGMKTQFQIYTVPGQVYYNSTRKLVLQGVDGVIFVADSSASMMEENLESLRNLQENLAEYGKDMATMPMVVQYNKRDLPDALPTAELERALNPEGRPSYEAVANTGQGVFPTLKGLAALVLDSIHEQTGTGAGASGAAAQSGMAQSGMAQSGMAQSGMASAPEAAPAPRSRDVHPPQPQAAQPPQHAPPVPQQTAPSAPPVAQSPPSAPAAAAAQDGAGAIPFQHEAPAAGMPPGFQPPPSAETSPPPPQQPPGLQQTGVHPQPQSEPQPQPQPQSPAPPQPQAPDLSQTGVHPQYQAPVPPQPQPQPQAPDLSQTGVHPQYQTPVPPQPQAPDLSQTGVHPQPQPHAQQPVSQPMGGPAPQAMPGAEEAAPGLRISHPVVAQEPPAPAPEPAAAHPGAEPGMMHVQGHPATPPAPATSRSLPTAPAPRIKPRQTAVATPSPADGRKSAMITAAFVTVALAAGVAIGGLAFGLF